MTAKHIRRAKRFLCLDCSVNTSESGEYYVVQSELWLSVVPSVTAGMLCIGCLEARIGRQLTADDFTNAFINRPDWHSGHGKSVRLLDRLGS